MFEVMWIFMIYDLNFPRETENVVEWSSTASLHPLNLTHSNMQTYFCDSRDCSRLRRSSCLRLRMNIMELMGPDSA